MNNLRKASMLKLDFLVEDGWMQSISNLLLSAVQKNTTNLFLIVINVSCGSLSLVHRHSFRWFLQKCYTFKDMSLHNQFNVRWSRVPNLLFSMNNFLFLCTCDEAAGPLKSGRFLFALVH
jgi:hypothetical protein